MTVTIENVSMRHLARLCEIELECFKTEAFTKQQIAYLLTDYNSIGLIAKENDKIVGFVIGKAHIERRSMMGHISTIDVLPAYRRKGTAQMLLQEIEKIFREKSVEACRLEVREDNIPALRLYQKSGYKKIGKLRNYYGNAHGLYLEKALI